MSEPTPFALSKLFTDLIGRKVTFTQTTAAAETKVKQMYGIYRFFPVRLRSSSSLTCRCWAHSREYLWAYPILR